MDIVQWLGTCVFPKTREEAYDLLQLAQSVIQYLDVYQAFFVQDYQWTCSLIEDNKSPLFPLPGEAYAPHEVRLLEAVNAQLFPLGDLEELLADASAENRYYTVPISPIGFDDLYDDYAYELYDLDLGWQFMLYLLNRVDGTFFDGMFGEAGTSLFELPIEQGWVDGEILTQECHKQRAPLSFFLSALEMIEHDTTIVWLDVTTEMPCDNVPWTVDACKDLMQEYQDALQIKAKAEEFIHWIEADPIHNFSEVINLWNCCINKTQQKEQPEKKAQQAILSPG